MMLNGFYGSTWIREIGPPGSQTYEIAHQVWHQELKEFFMYQVESAVSKVRRETKYRDFPPNIGVFKDFCKLCTEKHEGTSKGPLDDEFDRRYKKVIKHPTYKKDLEKMDTGHERIALGLNIIYDGYDNIPREAMDLSLLGDRLSK